MKEFFKLVVTRASIYYTVLVSVFCVLVLFTNASEETVSTDPARLVLFLPFCICFALGNTVMKYKSIEAVTRWLLHAVLTILGAFIFIILPSGVDTGSGNFMGLVLIVAIYFIGIIFSAILTARVKRSLKEDKELSRKSK